jgi:hypothetical protein
VISPPDEEFMKSLLYYFHLKNILLQALLILILTLVIFLGAYFPVG